MAGKESRPKATDPPAQTKLTIEKEIVTANEPGDEAPRASDPAGFDPRNSFYPQTLLKTEDLRIPSPIYRQPWYSRYAKPMVAVALVIGAVLAYVFFLSKPASVPATAAKDAPPVATKPAASGTITTPSAVVPAPGPVSPSVAP